MITAKEQYAMRKLFALVLALVLMLSAVPCLAQTTDDPALAEGADVRIMSFNLMNPDWSKVPVTDRTQKVVDTLLYYQPDVVGIQEANAKWQKALKPVLTETGLYNPACRQSNAAGFKYNMSAFMYNVATVQLVEEAVLDLDPGSDIRVLAVAVFEKLSDGTRFVVANTHPASSTETENYNRNCEDIMTLGKEQMEKYAGLPFIFTGDYNTNETSEMYTTLMENLGVKDAKYEADVLVRDHVTYIAWGEEFDAANPYYIDHIFVNANTDVKLFNVVVDFDMRSVTDHFPIYADIDLQ